MPKKKIGFTAESFGFGPISVSLNLIKHLRMQEDVSSKYEFVLFGNHVAKQLSDAQKIFDEIIECDVSNAKEISKYKEELKNFKFFVCNTNPGPLPVLISTKVPIVYIDLLFWMWKDLDSNLKKVDHYVIENFVDATEQKTRINFRGTNFLEVSPLIELNKEPFKEDSSFAFISFGGIDNIFSQTPPLIDYLLSVMLPELVKQFSKVIVAGGGNTIISMQDKYKIKYPNVEFGYFDRETFREHLKKATKCIVNPGLITFYECFDLNKDIFFLPSFNYSQYLQFQLIKKQFPKIPGWDYSFSESFNRIDKYLPEKEGLNSIYKSVEQFIKSKEAKEEWKKQFLLFLSKGKQKWNPNGIRINSGIGQVVKLIKTYL